MNAHIADLLGSPAKANDRQATIYIVRHGATKLNNQTDTSLDRIRGWKDVPLVEEGRQEAREAALKLKGKGIEALVASDLSRARETAEIIGKIIGLRPEFTENLRPWNVGTLQGTATKEALPKLAEYARSKPDEAVPEGESFNQFKARAFQGFAEAVAKHSGKKVLIVTHHRDERLIEAWDHAGQPEDHSIDLNIFLQKGDPPGGVKVLHASEAALKGNGMKDYAATNAKGREMMGQQALSRDDQATASPRQQFMDKYTEGAVQQESGGNMRDVMAHGRAIAGAKALHAVGHISEGQRDKHVSKSQKAIAKAGRKPFGAFAP